jgi:hypothetical protein
MFVGRGLQSQNAFTGRRQLDVKVDGTSVTFDANNALTVQASSVFTAGDGITLSTNTVSVNSTLSHVTSVGTLSGLTVSGAINTTSTITNTGNINNTGDITNSNTITNEFQYVSKSGDTGSIHYDMQTRGGNRLFNLGVDLSVGSNTDQFVIRRYATSGGGGSPTSALRIHRTNGTITLYGPLTFNSAQLISNVSSPLASTDVATKGYVDALASGIRVQDSVRATSTGNVDIASAPATIDGVTLTASDRVLLKDQSTAMQAGVYVFASAGAAMTRAADLATGVSAARYYYFTREGTTNAGRAYVVANAAGSDVVDTNALTFNLQSTTPTYTFSTGLTNTSGTVTVNVAQPQITSVGTLTSLALSGALTTTSTISSSNTTNATSVSTGSINTAGGIGVAQDIVSTGNILIGGNTTYRRIRMGGGNSSGFIYGAFATLGDGINIGYNAYNDNTSWTINNTGGATSRIRLQYGNIHFYTGGTNTAPTTEMARIDNGTGFQSYTKFIVENTTGIGNGNTGLSPGFTSKGHMYLQGASTNMLVCSQVGTGDPTYTTRSAGTKFILWPNIGASSADFALGYSANTLWQSVSTATDAFKWFCGTNNVMSLTGTALSVSAPINVNSQKITSLATPTVSTDAATKGYVDGFVGGSGTPTFSSVTTTSGSGNVLMGSGAPKIEMTQSGTNDYRMLAADGDGSGDWHLYDLTDSSPVVGHFRDSDTLKITPILKHGQEMYGYFYSNGATAIAYVIPSTLGDGEWLWYWVDPNWTGISTRTKDLYRKDDNSFGFPSLGTFMVNLYMRWNPAGVSSAAYRGEVWLYKHAAATDPSSSLTGCTEVFKSSCLTASAQYDINLAAIVNVADTTEHYRWWFSDGFVGVQGIDWNMSITPLWLT